MLLWGQKDRRIHESLRVRIRPRGALVCVCWEAICVPFWRKCARKSNFGDCDGQLQQGKFLPVTMSRVPAPKSSLSEVTATQA